MKSLTFFSFYNKISEFLSTEKRLLIAVSGGMDSMTLLHLFLGLRPNHKLFGVHVNHGLRFKSKSEQKFVERVCKNYNVPLFVKKINSQYHKEESIEMWARRVRYNAFSEVKRELNCDYVMTAHHANDSVETIIMHLNDGCGIEGLRGIPKSNGVFIRPLLTYKKSAIKDYIHKNKIDFIIDETNKDTSIKRNFVREKILKPWEEQSEDLIDRFINLSNKATNSINYMDILISSISNDIRTNNDKFIIPDTLTKLLLPSQFVRLIKELLNETHISWRRHRWESLIKWKHSAKTGSTYNINKYWTILRDRKHFILNNSITMPVDIEIQKEGVYSFNDSYLSMYKTDRIDKNNDPMLEVIDWNSVSKKDLKLRKWKKGDRFKPLGMKNYKKVSDFLIDKKIDRFSKDNQLVLTADNEIIWVCGQRISEMVKITNKTSNFMKLSLSHSYYKW